MNECALILVDGLVAGWQEKPTVSSARKESNKTIKVTGNDGHELVWKAVASYLCMNVHPYLVDFYSD